jgi:hypothetical protein
MSAPLAEEKVAIDKSPDSGSNSPSFSDESIENPTGIHEKTLLRKLDYKLLPGLTLLYLLSFLDRSNSMFFLRLVEFGKGVWGLREIG